MDQHHEPQSRSMGRVLAFPRSNPPTAVRSAAKYWPGTDTNLDRGPLDRWIGQAWVVLAWAVAVGRLQIAVDRREVFGAGDILAFLVAVLMPMMRGRKIFEALRSGVRFLRRLRIRSHAPRNEQQRMPKSA